MEPIPVGSVWRLVNYPEHRFTVVRHDNGQTCVKCDGEDDWFATSDISLVILHGRLRREF